ncbi:RNB domain-containing ribonuclease [Microbacteriaceae bacterium VKM Ac-2855]|nr:RNB domain-containing ribonuclease [Microbacteriaceae bacterium VKM Ac-2855]
MTTRRIRVAAPDTAVEDALAAVRRAHELDIDFPGEVSADARRAASAPDPAARVDRSALPFVTIDPVGSLDLDQAVLITEEGGVTVVRYAIADVPSYVVPGGALDVETRRRGQTIYLPDERVPLHPPVLSESAASLLPGVSRRAIVWTFELDSSGEPSRTRLQRATIVSVARLDYGGVQRSFDAGTPHPSIALLSRVGEQRMVLEAARGGASLTLPDEEIVRDEAGYRIERRAPLLVEAWNAQISLMTGMAAARIMLDAGIGILRTMPPADAEAVAAFRRRTETLGHPWSEDIGYGAYLRGLDTAVPAQLAIMYAAASLFRGAGYTAFDGSPPDAPEQAALAAPYAHTTAPLRRLVDRFVLALCVALENDEDVPAWVRDSLPGLPAMMSASDRLAGSVERLSEPIVEAAVLRGRIGESFDGVVVSGSSKRSTVQLREPELTVDIAARLSIGADVRLRLESVDVAAGLTTFVVA